MDGNAQAVGSKTDRDLEQLARELSRLREDDPEFESTLIKMLQIRMPGAITGAEASRMIALLQLMDKLAVSGCHATQIVGAGHIVQRLLKQRKKQKDHSITDALADRAQEAVVVESSQAVPPNITQVTGAMVSRAYRYLESLNSPLQSRGSENDSDTSGKPLETLRTQQATDIGHQNVLEFVCGPATNTILVGSNVVKVSIPELRLIFEKLNGYAYTRRAPCVLADFPLGCRAVIFSTSLAASKAFETTIGTLFHHQELVLRWGYLRDDGKFAMRPTSNLIMREPPEQTPFRLHRLDKRTEPDVVAKSPRYREYTESFHQGQRDSVEYRAQQHCATGLHEAFQVIDLTQDTEPSNLLASTQALAGLKPILSLEATSSASNLPIKNHSSSFIASPHAK